MRTMVRFLTICALSFGLVMVPMSDAEAKRFGGGKSFGSKAGHSSLFKRNANTPRSPAQQAAMNKNSALKTQMSQRGGLMGIIGGLAIGGLLGAMLFGGAFENINFFDILIFGAIAFLLWKLLAARRPNAGQQTASPLGGPAHQFDQDDDNDNDNAMRRESSQSAGPFGGSAFGGGAGEPAGKVPDGFKEQEFLAGASRAFNVLQEAWNTGDLSEIRGLTTDSMFGQVQDQFREADSDTHVEVLKVEGELLEVRELNGVQEATVMFDAILREGEDERPNQVREVWHFTREASSREPKWFLDGIQQLED